MAKGPVSGLGKIPQEYRAIFRAAKRQGWRIELRHGGHFCLYGPDGGQAFCGSSPGDKYRGPRYLVAALRRHGFQWDGR